MFFNFNNVQTNSDVTSSEQTSSDDESSAKSSIKLEQTKKRGRPAIRKLLITNGPDSPRNEKQTESSGQ